jgi:glycosyltransferase involved in cell wall biosynthesis
LRGLVSVVIPAYNARLYLADALASAFAQTYKPIEIIVVDDGSTDGTFELALGFGHAVSVTRIPHAGESLARNHGIAMARGEFIAFLDADDLWSEDKLSEQMNAFVVDPSLDLVFAHVEHFISPDLDCDKIPKIQHLMRAMPGLLPTLMLARRSAFDRAGIFESRWRSGPFVDWYMRAMDRGLRSTVLPATLAKRRLHESNSRSEKGGQYVDYVRVLKASLDRRRTIAAD